MPTAGPAAAASPATLAAPVPPPAAPVAPASAAVALPLPPYSPSADGAALAEPPDLAYRSDRLEWVLSSMCRRAGFIGGVVADDDGLALAAYNSPVSADRVAAFTTVLGAALARAGQLLGELEANNLSLDINFTDKAVLRRFAAAGRVYSLIVLCAQGTDVRSEIEVSIDQLARELATA